MGGFKLVALIVSGAAILSAILIGGIYTVVPGMTGSISGGTVYVINRFTGSVSLCTAQDCRVLRWPPPPFDPSKPFSVPRQ
jgi:hypothetical protein